MLCNISQSKTRVELISCNKQLILNKLKLPLELVDIIKSFSFYDSKTGEKIKIYKKNKNNLINQIKNNVISGFVKSYWGCYLSNNKIISTLSSGVFRKPQTQENLKDFPHLASPLPGFVEIPKDRRDVGIQALQGSVELDSVFSNLRIKEDQENEESEDESDPYDNSICSGENCIKCGNYKSISEYNNKYIFDLLPAKIICIC
jgi:hypothetical protein